MSKDKNELDEVCKEVIKLFPEKVAEYHSGQVGLLGMFVGEAMKRLRGQADPKELTSAMKSALTMINDKQPLGVMESEEHKEPTIDQIITVLKDKFQFDSSGTGMFVCELIDAVYEFRHTISSQVEANKLLRTELESTQSELSAVKERGDRLIDLATAINHYVELKEINPHVYGRLAEALKSWKEGNNG